MPARLACCTSPIAVVAVLAGTRRHAEVVERLHGRPGSGLVASVALVEGGNMCRVLEYRAHVVAGHVAACAIAGGSPEHAVDVAGSAARLDMRTGQGKPGLAVIELDQGRINGCRRSKMQHEQQREKEYQRYPPG